jgi:transketolase
MPTVKPIDEEAIVAASRETGAIVVAEEHLHHGGLGSVVAMVLARTEPCRTRFVDLKDTFATSGSEDELLEHFGLTGQDIVNAAREVVSR